MLLISQGTVEAHVTEMLDRLGLNSRNEPPIDQRWRHRANHARQLDDSIRHPIRWSSNCTRAISTEQLLLAQDLLINLAGADQFFDERLRSTIDGYIEKAGVDAPPDDREVFTFAPPVPEEIDLAKAGISSVVWASGYSRDYGWIDFPIVDEQGFPKQRRGASEVPGVYFLGSLWQISLVSATLFGPMVDGPPLLAQMG